MASLIFRIFLFFTLCFNLWATNPPTSWYSKSADQQTIINVDVFLSSTCTYCHKADVFFRSIEKKYSWLHIQRYTIDKDKNALTLFGTLLNEQNLSDFAVPSVFFCDSRWAGFASAETTGKNLVNSMQYCKEQIEKNGGLTSDTTFVLKRRALANMLDASVIGKPSSTQFITMLALMDSFNPCSFFALAAFFALIFLQENRKNLLLIGLTFILTIGAAHYVQQIFATVFVALLPWLRIPAVLVGLFTFYVASQCYRKRSSAFLFVALAFLLALMVQLYQQTCVMNWSYVFDQWLNNQQVTNGVRNVYQLSYQLLYLVPLIFILILYILLYKTRFLLGTIPKLQIIGLLFLLAIALLLITYPMALANLAWSLFILIPLFVCGWILTKFIKK